MRGATLPPTPPDAMQRKTVSREASVTSGKSPARSPHPKAWDASFVKTPAPTLDEAASFRASSSRDRAERVSREKHAHMEARAELLSLIAEAAADADVLGEAFSGKEGDVPGPGARSGALPPPRLASEIKERRTASAARRTARDARRRCGTCAGSREKPPPRAEKAPRSPPPRKRRPSERAARLARRRTRQSRGGASTRATRRLERRARPRRSRRKPRAEPRCRRSSPRARRAGASSSRRKRRRRGYASRSGSRY